MSDGWRDGMGLVIVRESNFIEDVFGPAVRDIKWDSQRHKRHQRWHLPDALKGASAFLTDRVELTFGSDEIRCSLSRWTKHWDPNA